MDVFLKSKEVIKMPSLPATIFWIVVVLFIIDRIAKEVKKPRELNHKNKPQIDTLLYSKFIETAVKSMVIIDDMSVHGFLTVRLCNENGKYGGKEDHIQLSFECKDSDGSYSWLLQRVRENWDSEMYFIKSINGMNSHGEHINGFTMYHRWDSKWYIKKEDRAKFPNFTNHKYIMQCLAEHTKTIKGVKNVEPGTHGYGELFFVMLHRYDR